MAFCITERSINMALQTKWAELGVVEDDGDRTDARKVAELRARQWAQGLGAVKLTLWTQAYESCQKELDDELYRLVTRFLDTGDTQHMDTALEAFLYALDSVTDDAHAQRVSAYRHLHLESVHDIVFDSRYTISDDARQGLFERIARVLNTNFVDEFDLDVVHDELWSLTQTFRSALKELN